MEKEPEQMQVAEGNKVIYVVEYIPLYGSLYFWIIEAKETPKCWQTVKVYSYAGNGLVKEEKYHAWSLNVYRKSDKRVFMKFEDAQEQAVLKASEMINQYEEKVSRLAAQLKAWSS